MADRDPSAYREALDRLAARKADARPVELALLQAEAADVHEAVRQQAEADALRAKAFPVLEGAGAVPFGVPGLAGPTAVRSTATFGWASLTARELEVVSLLAGSLSNAEIAAALHCSRRTVESHLSHVYTKLGLSSRVQLAVVAAERLRLRDA
jgi:DNA-binding CsgD family transcriptional regulator